MLATAPSVKTTHSGLIFLIGATTFRLNRYITATDSALQFVGKRRRVKSKRDSVLRHQRASGNRSVRRVVDRSQSYKQTNLY